MSSVQNGVGHVVSTVSRWPVVIVNRYSKASLPRECVLNVKFDSYLELDELSYEIYGNTVISPAKMKYKAFF